uniref:Uncharacterized protein n=1 Tax=Nicotiana tabacum TaxID=4097 RepID=A0A1S3Y0I1_TOBAC|nr:PREDICTED: uncharacterized protein LOC107770911 [Nicotiana tabacum]
MESVLSLRDEEEEEEEEESDFGLLARARASSDTQNTLVSVGVDNAPSRLDEVEEETLTQVPELRETEDVLPRGKETVEEAADVGVQTEHEAPQDGGGAQKDLLGEINIGDSPSFPSFSQSMIRDAQAVETCHGEGAHREEVPFRGYFIGVEHVIGPSDLEAPKKSSSEVGAPCLFNEAQQALNRYKAEVRRLTEERDALNLLIEQREGEVKGLRAELETSRKEQTELAEQVKQKFDVIRQLRVEVDVVKSEAGEWKKNMDRLASEKETAQTQLASAEAQLRSLKEKSLVQAKKIEEFQSRLSSANSDRERLATELAANSDALVVVYQSDAEVAHVRTKEVVEAAQAQANWVVDHAKCQSRRETLEEIHARGFDLTAEIEKAKELEVEARVLAFPDDDDTRSVSGSKSEGGLEGEDAAPGED